MTYLETRKLLIFDASPKWILGNFFYLSSQRINFPVRASFTKYTFPLIEDPFWIQNQEYDPSNH